MDAGLDVNHTRASGLLLGRLRQHWRKPEFARPACVRCSVLLHIPHAKDGNGLDTSIDLSLQNRTTSRDAEFAK